MANVIPAITSGGQQVLILKEGSSQSKGRDAQKNNIMAAKLVAEVVRTSLGPRGMDKMLVDGMGDVTITNDGATMLKEMDIQHPAAKMLVEVAKATDNEVGDGTTSSVVLAGALLEKAEELINKDVHPTIIVDGYRKASSKALEALRSLAEKINPEDRVWLIKVANTSLKSKLVSDTSDELATIAVDGVMSVAEKHDSGFKVDIDNIKVEKKSGKSMRDTGLIKGIVLDKEVVHSGMPKRIEGAKIALVSSPLEIEKTEFDAKLNINDPSMMKKFLDEENTLLKGMVDKIVSSGANVLICQKGIDDVAQHYLARSDILAVRRAKESDMTKLAKATGGRVVNNLEDLSGADLGQANTVEERKVEDDNWVFIEGCKEPKAVTILIRGGSQRVVDEAERSVHDAIMVVKDVMEKPAIVAGGGAPEAEAANAVLKWAERLSGREQLAARKFAEALESVALRLAENAGLDPIDAQVELRAKHNEGKKWYGVDIKEGKIGDMYQGNVFEPLSVKEQIIKSSTEAATMLLRIDDVIASAESKAPPTPPGGMGGYE
jgi:thermosome